MFPALLLAGLDPRAANITSTVALFPGQVVSGWIGRDMATGVPGLKLRTLAAVSLAGGAGGALLLLATPAAFFARLVPWLVLFATAVFAWGSFGRRPAAAEPRFGRVTVGIAQGAIAVYGGYFGGGIGFMMLAALTMAGVGLRAAGATKNMLAAAMNAAAIGVFVFSPDVRWTEASVAAGGAVLGSLGGTWLLRRVPERTLRAGVVAIGLALAAGLFLRGG